MLKFNMPWLLIFISAVAVSLCFQFVVYGSETEDSLQAFVQRILTGEATTQEVASVFAALSKLERERVGLLLAAELGMIAEEWNQLLTSDADMFRQSDDIFYTSQSQLLGHTGDNDGLIAPSHYYLNPYICDGQKPGDKDLDDETIFVFKINPRGSRKFRWTSNDAGITSILVLAYHTRFGGIKALVGEDRLRLCIGDGALGKIKGGANTLKSALFINQY